MAAKKPDHSRHWRCSLRGAVRGWKAVPTVTSQLLSWALALGRASGRTIWMCTPLCLNRPGADAQAGASAAYARTGTPIRTKSSGLRVTTVAPSDHATPAMSASPRLRGPVAPRSRRASPAHFAASGSVATYSTALMRLAIVRRSSGVPLDSASATTASQTIRSSASANRRSSIATAPGRSIEWSIRSVVSRSFGIRCSFLPQRVDVRPVPAATNLLERLEHLFRGSTPGGRPFERAAVLSPHLLHPITFRLPEQHLGDVGASAARAGDLIDDRQGLSREGDVGADEGHGQASVCDAVCICVYRT